jgi:hypothetical protein
MNGGIQMKRIVVLIPILAVCVGVAAVLLNFHTGNDGSKMPQISTGDNTSGPYRDGLYQGKLAIDRGSVAHLAVGRWADQADRAAFTAGYEKAYTEQSGRVSQNFQATNGPFRDGLYLGKLDANRGNIPHVAVGRWAAPLDRTSFADGYRMGYVSSGTVEAKNR